MKNLFKYCIISILAISACQQSNTTLPIYGRTQVIDGDTIQHRIPPFVFVNQDGDSINNASFSSHLYVSDFFFISCPSICPKVKKQMLRIYDKFEGNPKLKLVSHTIDPKRDTEENLKLYAKNLGVNTEQWMFLTGDKEELLDMADDYFIVAYEDDEAPGGFDHSGKILLVDTEGHIRAFAEGTDPEDVDDFLTDIETLLEEYDEQ